MGERTRWREQSESQIGEEEKKNGRLVDVPETSKELAEWRRLEQKKLEHTWPSEKSGLSAIKRAVGKYARAAFSKRKRNRAVSPEHQIMREIGVGAWIGKGEIHSEGWQDFKEERKCRQEELP